MKTFDVEIRPKRNTKKKTVKIGVWEFEEYANSTVWILDAENKAAAISLAKEIVSGMTLNEMNNALNLPKSENDTAANPAAYTYKATVY